jgi:hypothetical protein
VKGSLTTRKTSGRTGRGGYHTIDDRPTAHPAVQSFVSKLCSDPEIRSLHSWYCTLISSPLAWRLYKQINGASCGRINGAYYRGRRFQIDTAKPSSSELGPPPLEKQGEGRYTQGKSVVLYLSRTPETSALESGTDPSKPRIFIQKFELSIPNAKVLYLSKDLEDRYPNLHYLLVNSEYLPAENPFFPNPYRATQFVAFLCQLRGILAVEYPSVRGCFRKNPDAVNIVLFGRVVDQASTMAVGDPFEFQTNYL